VNPSTVALIDVGASPWPSESKGESSIVRAPSFSRSRFCKENEGTLEQLQVNGVHHQKVVRALFRSYTHLVNRLLQSYEDTSRTRWESGWTFSTRHADELLSPNVCKNDFFSGHLPNTEFINGLLGAYQYDRRIRFFR
jgi:hypothetical protein